MSDADIEKAVGPFWRNGAPVTTLDDVIARQAAELDALRARVAELEAELSSVLTDWNALVRAVGSPTHGGAVGHANALRAENARLRDNVKRHRDAAHGWERVARRRGAALEKAPEPGYSDSASYHDWHETTRREALDG